MARYDVIGLPTDGTWACRVCGSVVSNRQLHDTYAHADWAPVTGDTAEVTAPKTGCPAHQPRQHRDGKPPWCRACGRMADGSLPPDPLARPAKVAQQQYDDQPRRPAPGVYSETPPPQRTDPDQ